MIGRSGALAQLVDLVDASAVSSADQPAIALVAGEAGIGKTRLMREFAASLDADVVLLAGHAELGSSGRPYSLVSSLLGAREVTFDAVSDAIAAVRERVGSSRGLVIAEDLHWADSESAATLDRLAMQAWPQLTIVGTYRPEDLSRRQPGGELLIRLERRQAVERVSLQRLDRVEVGALLAAIIDAPVSSALIEAMVQRSGGNPFVIEELAGCCGGFTVEDLAAMSLPWSLDEAVKERVRALSPVERCVVETLAICGPHTSFDVIADVSDLDEPQLLEALRGLVEQELVVETSTDSFGFRHALVRDAVASQLLGRERRRLHDRALAALKLHAPDDLGSMARHAGAAGHFDELVEYGRAAAVLHLAGGSSFEALRLAHDALAEAPEDLVLLGTATQAAWLVGLNDEARTMAQQWFTAARHLGSLEEEAAATRWLVRSNFELGERDGVLIELARLEHLVDTLPDGDARARALAAIAQTNMLLGRNEIAIEWADRAIAAADAADLPSVRAQASIERGSARVGVVGRAASAELLAAVDEACAVGDDVLVTRGLNNLFTVIPAHSDEGRRLVVRFRNAAERAGFDAMSCSIHALREAEVALGNGDQPEFRRALQRVMERMHVYSGKDSGWIRKFEIGLALEEGRVADASAMFDLVEAEGQPERHAQAGNARLTLAIRAMGGSGTGRAAVSVDDLVAAGLDDEMNDDVWVAREVLGLVESALALGHDPDDLLERVLAAMPRPEVHERIERLVSGLVDLAAGRSAEGAGRLLSFLADPDPTLPRHNIGHLRVKAAEAALANGDRVGARALVHQALDQELRRWPGVRRDRGEALAHRIDGGASSGIGGELTAREREVASLLAEGLTNGELARRLYISPKTAAVHVSNILMKLEMSSRAEVAAWAVRTGVAKAVSD
jgi:DNA-binding CsgD family transcriptional regulator